MELQTVWFFIWGLLWAVFFMTDGFDLGIGTLYPFLGKSERDKHMMIHAMGPLWDGNEVWLLTAGGVTFAAFPLVYAVMFSSLYSALMLILFALILRGVSFEFRNKVDSPAWKRVWDTCIFVGSFLPALLFGVAFANIFKGIPIDQDGIYLGNLFTLLNPYGLLGGVLFLCLFLVHGALWLTVRADGDLAQRAERPGRQAVADTHRRSGRLSGGELRLHAVVQQLPGQPGPLSGTGHSRCRHRGDQVLSDAKSLFQGMAGIGGHHRVVHVLRRYRAVSQPVPLQHRCRVQPVGL